jgi:DNA-directed RNA polymerase subunit RPC12/RpoP
MKGRIRCPHCSKYFTANARDDSTKVTTTCPNCGYKITVLIKKTNQDCKDQSLEPSEECDWEERGEPRKTILTSIQPRTDKPMIAAILLLIIIIIGFTSAVFPEAYLQTPLDVLSVSGTQAQITVIIKDQNGIPLENVSVWVNPNAKSMTNGSGYATLENSSLGKQRIHVTSTINGSFEAEDIFILPGHMTTNITFSIDSGAIISIDHPSNLLWSSLVVIILSIVSIFGFIASWKRQHFDVALVCTIISIFTIGFYFIGSVLGFIALVLLLKSKEEFNDGKKGKSF